MERRLAGAGDGNIIGTRNILELFGQLGNDLIDGDVFPALNSGIRRSPKLTVNAVIGAGLKGNDIDSERETEPARWHGTEDILCRLLGHLRFPFTRLRCGRFRFFLCLSGYGFLLRRGTAMRTMRSTATAFRRSGGFIVGGVETGALENQSGTLADKTANLSAALGAFANRLILHAMNRFKLIAAFIALILISRHSSSPQYNDRAKR